jgi:hypothetical protein
MGPTIHKIEPNHLMTKKSFQDILCELIAARLSLRNYQAQDFIEFDDIYNLYVQLAKKIYNEQEPE